MFYGNLELPELDKIQTIKELLRVKSAIVWCFSDWFYVRVTVYLVTMFKRIFYLYFLYDITVNTVNHTAYDVEYSYIIRSQE